MVSWMSSACAIAILVPTPSVDEASTGSFHLSSVSENSAAKPPMPPITSGRVARSACGLIRSTAWSPAAMLTPAAAYVALGLSVLRLTVGRTPYWKELGSGTPDGVFGTVPGAS